MENMFMSFYDEILLFYEIFACKKCLYLSDDITYCSINYKTKNCTKISFTFYIKRDMILV